MFFDKESHTYTKNGKQYQGVSSWLAQFKQPFNADFIAPKVAKREGVETQEILDKWQLKGSLAINYGNAIHEAIEYWVRFGEIVDNPHQAKAVKELAKKYNREELHSEIVVFDDNLKLTGTIDLIKAHGNKVIDIIDIKTNATLDNEAYNNFKAPLEHLPQNKLNEYRLQQSAYKFLAEQMGITVNGIYLEHWNGSKYKTIELDPIDIKQLIKHKI